MWKHTSRRMHGVRIYQRTCTRVCGTPTFVHVVIRWIFDGFHSVPLGLIWICGFCFANRCVRCQSRSSAKLARHPFQLSCSLQCWLSLLNLEIQNMARQESEVPNGRKRSLAAQHFYSLWAYLVPKRRTPQDESKETLKQLKKQTCNAFF